MLWTTAQSLLGYTIGMPGFFSMVHLKETFGASFSQASLIFLFNALGAVLSTPWLGRWMDNAGAAAVMARLLAFAPISQMGWWFAPYGSFEIAGSSWPRAVVWMLPVSLVQGAVLTGALLCQLRLTQMTTNTGGRTVAMALHWSLTGIAGAVGALGAGWLQDHWRSPQSANASAWNFDTAFNFLVFASTLLTWFGAFPLMRALERRFSKPQIE
jgi:MFS family permease